AAEGPGSEAAGDESGLDHVRQPDLLAACRADRLSRGAAPASGSTHFEGYVERELTATNEKGDHVALFLRRDQPVELLATGEALLVHADDDVARQDVAAGPRAGSDFEDQQAVIDAQRLRLRAGELAHGDAEARLVFLCRRLARHGFRGFDGHLAHAELKRATLALATDRHMRDAAERA